MNILKKTLPLCLLVFTLYCMQTETQQHILKELKGFGHEVLREMLRNPDTFVAGIGLGTINYAINLEPTHISQKFPPCIVGAGIYGTYKYQSEFEKYLPKKSAAEPSMSVRVTAQAANVLVGAASAYCVLALANAVLKS